MGSPVWGDSIFAAMGWLGWAGLTVLPWSQGAESAGAVRLQGAGPCPLEGESGPSSTFFLVLVLVLLPSTVKGLRKRSWRGTRVPGATALGWSMQHIFFAS